MTQFHWLMPLLQKQAAVTFGVPWARGALSKKDSVTLVDPKGAAAPMQAKPLAYWPDGSVKWTAVSAVLPTAGDYWVKKGIPAQIDQPVSVQVQPDGAVYIENGLLSCQMQPGAALISQLRREGFEPMRAVLVAQVEQEQEDEEQKTVTVQTLHGRVDALTVEEDGPVRAVIRANGVHVGCGRTLFPFTVRLYFYRGIDQVKIVHTFVFDADEQQDFLRGMAVQFHLAADGALYNRHVGFAGEQGMFYEGVQGLYAGKGSYRRGTKKDDSDLDFRQAQYERQQLDGQFVQIDAQAHEEFASIIDDNAFWGSFRLSQDSCDHYLVTKRTVPGCAYIDAAHGGRSSGMMFFGSSASIFAVAMRDFWQKSPAALEITGAQENHPIATAWLYSPYAQHMDFRAYDTHSHKYSYGGVLNEPFGIANTSEMTLKLFDAMPGKQALMDFALDAQQEALLVARPEVYENTAVFGTYWKRAGDANPAWEKALGQWMQFYMDEVEQRRWYGFWDYGDVMHTYDDVRHCWRYDVGGFAWQNTELCNTYVNWLTFLRTGDPAIYRFARAMTRHCSEVDIYHAGPFASFGSRHNVRHWGCGAKEVRISMAGHHRFYYYLTADERIGDILDEVKDADFAVLKRDPMRSYFDVHEGFAHVRTGPDWTAFLSNWMTRWERYEDTLYRDKLLTSLKSVMDAPLGLSSGSTFHYEPNSGKMYYMGAPNPAGHIHLGDGNYQQHMVIAFGGAEVWFELAELLEDAELGRQITQFGAFYAMTPEQREAASGGRFNPENDETWGHPYFANRMIAYAAQQEHCEAYRKLAMEQMPPTQRGMDALCDPQGNLRYVKTPQKDAPRTLRELPGVTTNAVSQWSLNYMEAAHFLEEPEK